MIEEGEDAPTFELPAVRDGAVEQIALSDHLDDQVVILAFYPGDFNPVCDGSRTGLDDLDLFTMQKDVSILALSGDSVYSHRAFADQHDLHIPLLSDSHGRVAEEYGVAVEDETAGHLTRRAVVVIDHRGTIEYTWEAAEVTDLPLVDAIRTAVQNVGDDDSAFARYRVGHAHYMEGRRAFTSAMQGYDEKEWMMSKGDFDTAYSEFSEAEDEFNTAARFAENEANQTHYERAERKAESLWRAAEWLSDSANAYASGEGGKAISLREDAESPLENAKEIPDPPPPDEFPLDEDTVESGDQTTEDVSLEIDLDTAEAADEDERPAEAADEGALSAADATADDDDGVADDIEFGVHDFEGTQSGAADSAESDADTSEADTATPETADAETQQDADGGDDADDIDEEELEEIAAELEQQTEAAQAEEPDEIDDGNVVPSSIDVEEAEHHEGDPGADEDGQAGPESADDDGDIELDLTDPTEGEDEEEEDGAEDEEDDEDEFDTGSLGGGGDHGVPDSL